MQHSYVIRPHVDDRATPWHSPVRNEERAARRAGMQGAPRLRELLLKERTAVLCIARRFRGAVADMRDHVEHHQHSQEGGRDGKQQASQP